MKYFKENMKLLKMRSKRLYQRLDEYHNSEKVIVNANIDIKNVIAQIKDLENELIVNVEKSKKGNYTIKVFKEDQEVYLHSRYAPLREAKKLVDRLNCQGKEQILALGFGLGYHLIDLIDRYKFNRMFIIEPYLIIFYTAMLYNDLSSILNNFKLLLIIEDEEHIYSYLRAYYKSSIKENLIFFENLSSLSIFKSEYNRIYTEVNKGVKYSKMALHTFAAESYKWRNNIILNLPLILQQPKVDSFFNCWKGKPAVCVVPGPSLDKNIHLLKEVKGKALLIAIGGALKPLLKAGIKPDIAIHLDGGEGGYKKYFKKLPNLKDVFLFSMISNYYSINKEWQGPQVFFTTGHEIDDWVESMNGPCSALRVGGTVTHSMVDLAYNLGADPIILVGQDLAYDGKKAYSSKSSKGELTINNDEDLLLVEGINGDKVYTTNEWYNFKNFYEEYFSNRPDRIYIDATEGGAKIKHTKIMTLAEVIGEYCLKEYEPLETLKEIYQNNKDRADLEDENIITEFNYTIAEVEGAINILDSQLIEEIKKARDEIEDSPKISDERITEIEKRLKIYHDNLNAFERINYFTDLVLSMEKLKYEEVDDKRYLDRYESFKEKIKYYQSYWVKYLTHLKDSLRLLLKTKEEMKDGFRNKFAR